MISVPGFLASGVSSGIKKSGKKDLALIFSEVPARAVGVFTTNLVKAAPVLVGMERIKQGVCQALIINSGNANACTGKTGFKDSLETTEHLAKELGIENENIIPSSTGVIGQRLEVNKIKKAIRNLIKNLSKNGFGDTAEAIMTTDQFPKYASRKIKLGNKTGTIAAIAKGAGMISPNMATMLCFILTDINISRTAMKRVLVNSVENSFNKIIVDGDTSTNDSVFLLANTTLDNKEITLKSNLYNKFEKVLTELNVEIAEMIVKDGEGATKIVKIEVQGARTDKEAQKIARNIGNSQLVKTAFFGEDANWGRLIASAGSAGVQFDPDKNELFFDKVRVYKNGTQFQAESKYAKVFKQPKFTVTLKLKEGKGSSYVLTSDLTLDYVKINSHYRT